MRITLVTIFANVYGQSLAIRGPTGSVTRSVDALHVELESILKIFAVMIAIFLASMILTNYVIMTTWVKDILSLSYLSTYLSFYLPTYLHTYRSIYLFLSPVLAVHFLTFSCTLSQTKHASSAIILLQCLLSYRSVLRIYNRSRVGKVDLDKLDHERDYDEKRSPSSSSLANAE